MRLKNIRIIILVLLIGIGFASCEEYRWVGGYLDRKTTVYTDNRGIIYESFRVDERDLFLNRSGSIDDLRFVGNDELRLDINTFGRVSNLFLHIDGTDVELYFKSVVGNNDYYGGDVEHFMSVVVEEIRRRGFVTINVDGESQTAGLPLDIQMLADVEAYVRY